MKNIQAVLFDLDGTLADTAPDLGASLNQLRQEEGLPAIPLPELRKAASRGVAGLLVKSFANGASDPQERKQFYESLRQRFLVFYEQRLCDQARLFPQARETLAFLSATSVPWSPHPQFSSPAGSSVSVP